jgi:hypothetical protein
MKLKLVLIFLFFSIVHAKNIDYLIDNYDRLNSVSKIEHMQIYWSFEKDVISKPTFNKLTTFFNLLKTPNIISGTAISQTYEEAIQHICQENMELCLDVLLKIDKPIQNEILKNKMRGENYLTLKNEINKYMQKNRKYEILYKIFLK